ncbi:Uncharacterised protein [Mycobacterium tuberculosis]|nr:Uncharacterised protein [Mycobacterium tuberculosis]
MARIHATYGATASTINVDAGPSHSSVCSVVITRS